MAGRVAWLLGSVTGALVLASGAQGQTGSDVTRNTFGLPGLADMPTAESAPEGVLGGSFFRFAGAGRTTLTFQVTDRLTGAFRYSRVTGVLSDGSDLYDRSFDLHYRLLDEGAIRPAVAIGLRDFIGTGVYSSEYIVATKSVTPDLKVTAGLGWGRLGSLGGIGTPFGDRPPLDFGEGGKANTDQWFRGPVAPFFGLSWRATDQLTLKAEYSSDDYAREVAAGAFEHNSAVNVGADYRFRNGVTLSGYYLYGAELGLQLRFELNPRQSPYPSGLETAPLPVRPRPAPSADPEGWSGAWANDPEVHPGVQDAVAKALAKDGQMLEGMALSATQVEVRVRNNRYLARPQAIGRTARILTRAVPPSVETFVITSVVQGMPTSSVTLRRSDVEALEGDGSLEILRKAGFEDALRAAQPGMVETEGLYPRFSWALTPNLQVSLFDPDNPMRADLGIKLGASYEIRPGLILSGAVTKKIIGNIDDAKGSSDSLAPHVRSDLVEYQRHGDPAISHLTLAHYGRPMADVYSRVTLGYLEQMYGGVSGEVLWKPVDSRLALGLEVNYAKQRDFNQLLAFRDYDVVTGHASAYYDFGKGFVGQVDVGRYLAGDVGATLALDRYFANGWRVGAYATFTDMPTSVFGEGSFDKGIRLTIPLAFATATPSAKTFTTTLKPLNRDGGARLAVDGRLYELVRDSHQGTLQDRWGRFWR